MKTRTEQRRIYIRNGLLVLAFFVVVSVGLFFLDKWDDGRSKAPVEALPESTDVIEYNGEKYTASENIETVLFVGLDAFSEDAEVTPTGELRADFVLLLIMDNESKTAKTLQISRDTMVDYSDLDVTGFKELGTLHGQLALSHTEGNGGLTSLHNTSNAVSKLLGGVKIDKVISVKMDAVPTVNDMVEGVTVTVLHDFGEVEPSLVKDKEVTLTAEQALTYVRARKGVGDGSNEQRMARQRQYLNALYNSVKAKADSDSEFIVNAIVQLSEYLVSDCVEAELEQIFKTVNEYSISETETLKGTSKLGEEFMEFYPDEEALKQYIVETFYEKIITKKQIEISTEAGF